MSHDQELSILGVTSTIRPDDNEDTDDNDDNNVRNKSHSDDYDIEEEISGTSNSQRLLVNNNLSVSLRNAPRTRSSNASIDLNLEDANNGIEH